jgi:hypothetical protein
VNDNAGHLPQTSGAFFRLYSASSQHVLDRPRLRAAHIARASAAEPHDGERSISQSFVSGVDLRDAVAARAPDLDLQAERGYLAECLEG